MAGAVRGGLRPHHPTKHSFIVVGLVLVVIVLGFNYWSISTKNSRLAAELAKVHKNYKLCSEQYGQLSSEKKRQENTVNEKDRELEDTRRRLVDKEADVAKLQSMQHRYDNELQQCRDNVTACSATVQQSHVQLESCNEKVEKLKAEQNEAKEACSRQLQSEIDQLNQLKHEHVLDKRKAIEQALQLSRQQRQSAQQKAGQQKLPTQQIESWQQKLNERWRQKLSESSQQRKIEQQSANQEQRQQLAENKQSQQQQNRQPSVQQQDVVLDQQFAEPGQLAQEQALQQNLQKKQYNEQPLQQLPVQRKRSAIQQLNNPLAGISLQLRRIQKLQQSLQAKADQQHPLQVPQDVAEVKQKTVDEQAPIVSQHPNHEPQQQPEQKMQEPLVFQVPAPVHASDYKQSIGEQRAKRDVQNLQPDRRQLVADINRQQQFEQLQQDKLHEPVQSQKENDHVRPLMVPQQSEDQPSLLGNAREPPHLEGVLHVTGQIMTSGIKDVAVRAPDGSMGQFDSVRNDQLRQQGVAPGFENMQNPPVPVKHAADAGQDNGRDESQRDYGPMGQREADVNRRVHPKDVGEKAEDEAVDMDDYQEDKQNGAPQPAEIPRHDH